MSIHPNRAAAWAVLMTGLLCSATALAADSESAAAAGTASAAPAAATQPAAVPDSTAPAPRANLLQAKPVDLATLSGKRGGSDTFSEMSLRGVVADNRAVNVATGGNLVTQGALAGASGVPMLVQNTGNNVLIQNATIINVQLK